ncbi:hypothetical protein [Streptomyces flaveolus]|uniref:Integral membrane protein n=1 Tax=Streptomyces flaveolus TaxID=67297 RepID=A0ABV3AD86_9ACTN
MLLVAFVGAAIGLVLALVFFGTGGIAGNAAGVLIVVAMGAIGWRAVYGKVRDRRRGAAAAERCTPLRAAAASPPF